MHIAAGWGTKDMVALLLSCDADEFMVNKSNLTPVEIAEKLGRDAVVGTERKSKVKERPEVVRV